MQKLKFKFNIQLFATEEEAKQEQVETKEEDNNKYIEALQEVKKNSVDKGKYDALEQENKKLLQALIDGEQVTIEQEASTPTGDRIKELHKEMFVDDFEGSDLDYCQKALELRDLIIERDGEDADPFLPHSHDYLITEQDREARNRVASELKEAIESSNGSNKVFIATLQEKMVDSAPMKAGKRK